MNTITITNAASALEAVPTILGFTPIDSLVVLADSGMTARVDWGLGCHLPILEAVRRNHFTPRIIVGYEGDPTDVAEDISSEYPDEVMLVISVDGIAYTSRALLGGQWQDGESGLIMDTDSTPLRTDLEASLTRTEPWQPEAGATGARGLLAEMVTAAGRDRIYCSLTDHDAAERLIPDLREAHVHAPEPLGEVAAGVLALAYWIAGNGAMSLIALDHCTDHDAALYRIVDMVLVNGLNPKLWVEEFLPAILADVAS